jgi:hypothetical protein
VRPKVAVAHSSPALFTARVSIATLWPVSDATAASITTGSSK